MKRMHFFSHSLILPLVLFVMVAISAAPQLLLPCSAQQASTDSKQDPGSQQELKDPVKIHLVADTTNIQAGKPFTLSLELNMEPGWHTYYKDPGDAGLATSIKWVLPKDFTAGELIWEKPTVFNDAGIKTNGYQNHTSLKSIITPPSQLPTGSYTFTANAKWLVCKEVCLPGSGDASLTLASGNGAALSPAASTGVAKQDILTYLSFAFLGGFILNFMPCVLPVISIKLLSFLEQARDEPKAIFTSGLIFSAGIISSFLFLGGIVITVRNLGHSIGWGFQFQHPGFLVAMCTIVLLLSLSLMGLFYISPPQPAQAGVDHLAMREGATGTFFKGVLATFLSTPCTAPFLGTAVGFAFTQPWWMVLAIFLTVSLGMAFPYVLLTAKPQWMRYLPKPGAWMETVKEAMGFLLMATVVWLLSVLGQEVGLTGAMYTLAFLLCIAFATWLVGRFIDLSTSDQKRYAVWSAALVIAAIAYNCFIIPVLSSGPAELTSTSSNQTNKDGITWQPYTTDALNTAIAGGKTVFLDFTADWCLTCKVNEQTVINTQPVLDKFKALNVVTMKADWTRQNPEISSLLQKFGRSGVPLYVIYPANNPNSPIVLPEVITQSLVLDKLTEAGPSKS